MATNPRVPQGTLSRIRGSLIIPDFPALNVTAPFLTRAGISLSPQGNTTNFIPTQTGAVTSPEPYLQVQLSVGLIKSQPLAAQYRARIDEDARLGDGLKVVSDTNVFPDYTLNNCAIEGFREITLNGDDPTFMVMIQGYIDINNSLWNMV